VEKAAYRLVPRANLVLKRGYTLLKYDNPAFVSRGSMSTLAENPPAMSMAANDDFQALEERVLRTVELLKSERERRASIEQHSTELSHRVEEQSAHIARLEDELSGMQRERDAVRQRIERLLKQLDEV
jgi:septal ring factor EnvC (AmiA/AmiB activator)